jgi:hypothetical protein
MRPAPAKHVNESPALDSPVIANTREQFTGWAGAENARANKSADIKA